MGKNIYVGVDLGGTKILACPFKLKNGMYKFARAKVDTNAREDVDNVIDRIETAIRQSVDNAGLSLKKIKAIGLGVPGTTNIKEGRVLFAANLNWKDINIKKILEKRLKIPVFVDNDVNLGTLGEQRFGAAQKVKNVAGVFWGTGIGGALIVNNKLVHGYTFTAGEIGHLILDKNGQTCSCGNQGCLETFSAKWALSETILGKIKDEDKELLGVNNGNNNQILKSGKIKNALLEENKVVVEALDSAIEYLALALANVVNVINPQMIVLGGGVIEAMEDEILPKIKTAVEKHTIPFAEVDIRAAELGDDAVVAGAAYFAKKMV